MDVCLLSVLLSNNQVIFHVVCGDFQMVQSCYHVEGFLSAQAQVGLSFPRCIQSTLTKEIMKCLPNTLHKSEVTERKPAASYSSNRVPSTVSSMASRVWTWAKVAIPRHFSIVGRASNALSTAASRANRVTTSIRSAIPRYAPVVLWWICLVISISLFTLHIESQLSTPKMDPYDVLELEIGSNRTQISRQFRKVSLRHHKYLDSDLYSKNSYH